MTQRILCLDLGTHTGWALTEDGVISSGVETFDVGRHCGGGMRFLRFKRWLIEMQAGRPFDAVYYEEVARHAATHAAHVYGAFWGILTSWCEHHDTPYQGVPVGTIKKFATSKGNADKELMIRFARDAGFNVEDDNEADAIHLLRYALRELVPKAAEL